MPETDRICPTPRIVLRPKEELYANASLPCPLEAYVTTITKWTPGIVLMSPVPSLCSQIITPGSHQKKR